MKTITTEEQLSEQLTSIQQQLSDLSSEMALIRKTREEINDLKDDLTMVAKDAFQTAVMEMEEVAPFVQTGELVSLLKRLVRNTKNFNGLLDQLESAHDFFKDAQPLGKELFHDGLEVLNEVESKGYFEYAREFKSIMDNIVDHFTVEDVKLLSDNIVTILETVKNLTQPEMLNSVNNAVKIFKHLDPDSIEEYSVFRVAREANSKEMRRAMGLFFTFLKNLSAEYDSSTMK